MTLTEMADSLVGQESKFSKSIDTSLDLFTQLKDNLAQLEKEISKKSIDQAKLKKTME